MVSFDSWKEGNPDPTSHELTVVAPKPGTKDEAVSARLKQELIHPHRNAWLVGLRFSPDGRQIIAGDYPDGLVEVWDVPSGKLLTGIETGYAMRGSAEYLHESPDWHTLYVWKAKAKYEHLQEGNKTLTRWQFDGEVRAWDLGSGKLVRTFKHQPPRNIRAMQLSPDGGCFVTWEEVPGVFQGRAKQATSLWHVRTGQYQPLPDHCKPYWAFSPDGKTLVGTIGNENGYDEVIKLFDTATGQEKLSIPIPDKLAEIAAGMAVSPDGRLLVGTCRSYESAKKWDKWHCSLKWWDTATGQEVASFSGSPQSSFAYCQFSPDGETLAVIHGQDERKLLLYRVRDRKQISAMDLGKPQANERSIFGKPAFRPDSKWLAIVSGMLPIEKPGEALDARDAPQPRIYLIDVATGEIRETLVSPHTLGRGTCFSPDGRILATVGLGKVLLWDVANLGGNSTAPERSH